MKDLPDWRLVIVGDGPERQNLETRIKNLELNSRVQLVGSVPREKLLELLGSATVFVLNTSFESFSFQTVEAMNAGAPAIVTNIGSLPEIVESGKEGIVIEPNNQAQILAAIKKISEDRAFREMIVKNAKEKAKQFSISRTVDNLVNLINETSSQ
jgi:glycosyltransferase involved in cell wall biosynthesis